MQRYAILFLPVVFTVTAQLLVKNASFHPVRSSSWVVAIVLSIACYLLAFVLYSNTVRHFPISIASPVNTLAVMVVVVAAGTFFWGEALNTRQIVGLFLGVISLVLLCSEG